ncbi:oligosaccharide flippase family protein [Glaesserella parasuis]|uniref:Uncharacterized protein n=1 Tax=Glaesserella parasuis TaxID=738 RepID=T1RQ66_GLAPU|nr:oligosaccharide flippase family protein [Glaesserella parasuis]EQA05976.1 polysaccharide biosynthesis family protein [Glaesserella parasuis 12939]AGM38622.1 hypothetical protein [Glaesserella parasuis]AMW16054.1 hypothetical protein A4U84_01725 [Glaesserella parasuis]MCT8518430.1 oligosaccharide flippase family protein [Glaesserella parasuis]MCT8742828.1 oligosaccharide flippase family protein [Glaesserella parasuis]
MHKKFLNNKLIKNAVSLGILQISNYVFPLLIWPLLAKFLGVENFGLVMIVFSILTLAYMFTDFGFNISVTHLVAQYYNDRQRIGVLLGNIFLIKLILSVIVSVATTAYILVELSDKIDLLALIFINITIFSQAFHCIWFFQGIERMGVITKVNIIAKIGYTILVFIILSLYQHINVVFFCFLINQTIVAVLFIINIYKNGFFVLNPTFKGSWRELKYSFSFFISRISVSVYTTVNVLILGHFLGTSIAGLYSAAEKIYSAVNGVFGIVAQTMYPYMVKTGNIKLLCMVVGLLSIPVCFMCYILSLYVEEIILLLFGNDFLSANELVKQFLFLACITFVSFNMGYPAFSAIKRVKWANYTVVIGGLLHLSGLFILIILNQVNMKNVLLMVIFTESFILLCRIFLIIFFLRNVKYI